MGVGVVVVRRRSRVIARPPPRPPSLRFGGRPSPQGGGQRPSPPLEQRSETSIRDSVRSSPSSLSGDADAGWRRRIIGYEEGGRERLARVHAVFLEVGDALGREEGIVDQEVAGEAA